MEQALKGIPGIVDLHVQLQSEVPQMQVEVDLAKAQQYGLKPGDVRRAAATLMAGEEVGDLFRDGKAYDVNVWSTPATRSSLSSIRDLPIDTPDGGHVRLGDVADVRIAPAQSVIYRENASRRIDVSANVKGRDLGCCHGARSIAPRANRVPAWVSRRGARRVCRAAGRPEPPAALRDRRGDRDVPDPAGVLRELAPGGARLLDLALGAGGRRAGGVLHRRRRSRLVRWSAFSRSLGLRPATKSC